jgi:hypothetical protein
MRHHDVLLPACVAGWSTTPSSFFAVVNDGVSRVYQQTSSTGNAAAFLQTASGNDQSRRLERAHGTLQSHRRLTDSRAISVHDFIAIASLEAKQSGQTEQSQPTPLTVIVTIVDVCGLSGVRIVLLC